MFEPSGAHECDEQRVNARHKRRRTTGARGPFRASAGAHRFRPRFCAGADLQQVADDGGTQESTDDGSEQLGGTFNRALTDLMDCPVPTVAKVNGAAAGGGFGLALSCDITIAAESAFFVATFGPNLGIVPDMGTTWNLPLRAGRARAR